MDKERGTTSWQDVFFPAAHCPLGQKLAASRSKVSLQGGNRPPDPPDWRLWRERPHWGTTAHSDPPKKRLWRAGYTF
eukprot:15465404-Alexandrium_andersonii.AAC.1